MPLDDVLCGFRHETCRNADQWNMSIRQTEGPMTFRTVEMAMEFLDMALMVRMMAEAVFLGTAAVLDLMQEMMFIEGPDDAEDRRFIDRVQAILQIPETEGVLEGLHGTVHQHPHGGQSDPMHRQDFLDAMPIFRSFFHICCLETRCF